MDKIIKEFKENKYTYELGYGLFDNKVYPYIKIYKNGNMLSRGGRCIYGTKEGFFDLETYDFSSNFYGHVGTINELFNKLREYSKISEEVEKEFENIFILYKMNNFKEI